MQNPDDDSRKCLQRVLGHITAGQHLLVSAGSKEVLMAWLVTWNDTPHQPNLATLTNPSMSLPSSCSSASDPQRGPGTDGGTHAAGDGGNDTSGDVDGAAHGRTFDRAVMRRQWLGTKAPRM